MRNKRNYDDSEARMVTEEDLKDLYSDDDAKTVVEDNLLNLNSDDDDVEENSDEKLDDNSDARIVTEEELDNLNSDDNDAMVSNEDNLSSFDDNKKYYSKKSNTNNFNTKFFLHAFLVILFSFLAAFFIKRSFAILGKQNITYQEKSNLDYKVYLKENDFYEKEFFDKNMVYVASLIDRIDIDFDYIFKIDRKSNIDFEYDIVGKLIISDTAKERVFFEKDYVLLENTKDSMVKDGLHQIVKSVSIDYSKYNNLANQFKSKYGVDVNSRLVVYLNVHEVNASDNKFSLSNNSSMSLSIPLSERAINISMDYNEVNKTSKLVRDEEFVITNYLYVFLGLVFSILFVIVLIKFILLIFSLRSKKSKYDKYVSRILREYDRLIVETVTMPNLDNKNVINISKFQELLDVRDNLKLPIKYCVVKNHHECYFYINHEEELYLFRVLDNDFEGEK